jgi:hypothetical protein
MRHGLCPTDNVARAGLLERSGCASSHPQPEGPGRNVDDPNAALHVGRHDPEHPSERPAEVRGVGAMRTT